MRCHRPDSTLAGHRPHGAGSFPLEEIGMKKLACALALALAVPQAWGAAPAPMTFERSTGGAPVDPVVAGGYVYLPTGPTLTVWNSAGATPLQVGDTGAQPLDGYIVAAVVRGNYLYASFDAYDDVTGGVAVYSLADPAHPQLLSQLQNFIVGSFRNVESLALANDTLFLFDSETGIYAGNLANPAQPVFTRVSTAGGTFDRAYASGNFVYTTGRSFLGDTIVTVFDMAQPASPVKLGSALMDGFDNFRVRFAPPYAVGFGTAVNVPDFSDPTSPAPVGRIDTDASKDGLLNGVAAYALGASVLTVWNLTDRTQPSHVADTAISTLGATGGVVSGGSTFVATTTDKLFHLDTTTPLAPALAGTAILPGGSAVHAVAFNGDTTYILTANLGLHIAEAATLAPHARFAPGLDSTLQARDYEGIALDGNRAYLAAWGTGLVIADITDARKPQELGRFDYPFATAVLAHGNIAYVGRSTNGGQLVVLDVSNPANPTPLGYIDTGKILRLARDGNHIFIADGSIDMAGGVRIVDVGNPASPTLIGYYDGCSEVSDIALSADAHYAYAACNDHVDVLDVSNPTVPSLVTTYADNGAYVALRGDRAYIAGNLGLDEVDISNPP